MSAVDAVVVGSGAGGAAVAGALRAAGASVAVVEAGAQLCSRPGSHVRNRWLGTEGLDRFGAAIVAALGPHAGARETPRDVPAAIVAHAVGGGLAYWTHHCPEPHEREWPVALPADERARLLARARAALRVSTELRGGVRQRRLLEVVAAHVEGIDPARPVQPLPVAGERTPAGIRYAGADDLLLGGDDALGPRTTLLANHVARRVLLDGSRAAGVEAVPRDGGAPRRIAAGAVVVAAGAIGSPQLLHASGVRLPALGRHLMDHPMLTARVTLAPELLEGVPADDPEFAVWAPFGAERPRHLQVVRSPLDPDARPSSPDGGASADVVAFCGLDPHPGNALRFDAERLDPFGLPAVEATLEPTAADRGRIADALAEQFRVATAIGRVQDGFATRLGGLGSSIHLMGTVRLGTRDDGGSVADDAGRVWGHDGLYVAGNGVLGAYNAGNPTLLTVALALRTADAVLAG